MNGTEMECSISSGPPDDYPIKCKSFDCDEVVKDEGEMCPECWQCYREDLADRWEDNENDYFDKM